MKAVTNTPHKLEATTAENLHLAGRQVRNLILETECVTKWILEL